MLEFLVEFFSELSNADLFVHMSSRVTSLSHLTLEYLAAS